MMRHLDETSQAALANREPEATAYFADHLKQPCDVCEAFLASQERALGGAADATLHHASDDAALDELGYRRLQRRGRRPVVLAMGALAAALLAVVLVPSVLQRTREDRTKAVVEPVALELSAVLQLPDGTLRPLAPGAQVPDHGTILLRYRASGSGEATLRLGRASGAPQELASFRLQPGLHDLEVDGDPVGISLDGETGRILLVVDVTTPGGGARATIPIEVVPAR